MSFTKEFKEFVLRGNVVDLAVGVVIGAAFGAVVKSFTADLITPLIGTVGHFDFNKWTFTINGSVFQIGDFVNVTITFLLTALVVFLFVVKPVNWLMSLKKSDTPTAPDTRECPECLSKIPVAATRCAFCTAVVNKA